MADNGGGAVAVVGDGMVAYAGQVVPWWTVVARWHWTELVVGWQISTHGVTVEVVEHPRTADVAAGPKYGGGAPSYWRIVGPCLLSIGTGQCDCRPDGWRRTDATPWCREAEDVRSRHHVAMVETVAVADLTESSGLWPFVKVAGDRWGLQIRADLAEAVTHADGVIRT